MMTDRRQGVLVIGTVAWLLAAPLSGMAESVLFSEDFSGDLGDWDVSHIEPERDEGRLFFFSTEGEWLVLDLPIPMEDVAIEFDGYTERNGFTVAWSSPDESLNSATIGGWFNSKSVLKVGAIENAVYKEGSVWRPRTWHRYRVVRQGSQFIVYCDERIAISRIEPARLEGTGKLRFSSWDSRLGIDNVRILALTADAPGVTPGKTGGAGAGGSGKVAEASGRGDGTPPEPSLVDSVTVHIEPAGDDEPVGVDIVPAEVRLIYISFTYHDLGVGDLLFGRLWDEGRHRMVREMPLILMSAEGAHSFSMARGITPWLPGPYRLEIAKDGVVLKTTSFEVSNQGGTRP